MMKRSLVALLVLALFSGAAGQEKKKTSPELRGISLFAGGAWSRYSGMPAVATIPEIRPAMGSRSGAAAGFLWEYRLSDHLLVDNGLQYIRKGTAVNWYYFDEPRGSWIYNLELIAFPITLRFKPWARSSPYVLAGYELAFIAGHRLTDSTGSAGPVGTNLKGGTYDVDLSLIAGAGAEIVLKKLIPFVEIRYYHGLLDISKGVVPLEYYPTIRTRALVVLAGVRFRWKQKASE
jgi:hypothetical protein